MAAIDNQAPPSHHTPSRQAQRPRRPPGPKTDTASPADGTEPVPPPCRAPPNPARQTIPALGGTGSALSAGNQPLPSHLTPSYPPQRWIRPRRRTGRSPSLHPAGHHPTQPEKPTPSRRDRLRPVRRGPTTSRDALAAGQLLRARVPPCRREASPIWARPGSGPTGCFFGTTSDIATAPCGSSLRLDRFRLADHRNIPRFLPDGMLPNTSRDQRIMGRRTLLSCGFSRTAMNPCVSHHTEPAALGPALPRRCRGVHEAPGSCRD